MNPHTKIQKTWIHMSISQFLTHANKRTIRELLCKNERKKPQTIEFLDSGKDINVSGFYKSFNPFR